MYCRNCGCEIHNTKICPNCGVAKGEGDNYCPDCGEAIEPNSSKCVFCSAKIRQKAQGAKSKIIAGLLGIFLGWLGLHNFYLGYNGKGVFQLVLSFLFFGSAITFAVWFWGIYEGICILTGKKTHDAYGIPMY